MDFEGETHTMPIIGYLLGALLGTVVIAWLASLLLRVDSGRGQNRTLRPLSTFWPPVFAGEQDVGPPKG